MRRVSALFLALFLLFSATTAGQAAKRPGAKLPQSYLAQLHVAGGVTITSRHNSLRECTPGQAWTMTEKADLVINDVVRVQRYGKVVTSSFATEPGAVSQRSRLSGYRTTNSCPPAEPVELVKPKCRSLTGMGMANLVPDPRRNGKVSIAITRKGGGKQNLTCFGPGIDATPRGTAITALQLPFTPITLPLNLGAGEFKKLMDGKRLISRVQVAGACKFAVAAPMRSLTKAAEDDACEVAGVFNVIARRIGD